MILLDPAALAGLEGLHVRARCVVEGALSGLHRSPQHGQSVEFAEHKEYSPGDEIRHIDWRAMARTDRYYVKRFEQETNLRAYLVIDTSKSMDYRGAPLSKLQYAATLAAALASVLLRQQDQVSLLACGSELTLYLPPRAHGGHLTEVISALEGLRGAGDTDLNGAATMIFERAKRRSLIVVFSDLLDMRTDALSGFCQLRAARHDVAVMHLLDPHELHLPFTETALFEGLEGEGHEQQLCDPEAVRAAYLEELAQFLGAARRTFTDGDIDYRQVDTASPPAQVLREFLSSRMAVRSRA